MTFTAFDALRQCQDETDRKAEDAAVLALCASSAVVEIWKRPDVVETVQNFAEARDAELGRIAELTAFLIRSAEEKHRENLARIERERRASVDRTLDLFETRQRGFIQHHAWRAVKGYPAKVCNMFRVNVGATRLGLGTVRPRA